MNRQFEQEPLNLRRDAGDFGILPEYIESVEQMDNYMEDLQQKIDMILETMQASFFRGENNWDQDEIDAEMEARRCNLHELLSTRKHIPFKICCGQFPVNHLLKALPDCERDFFHTCDCSCKSAHCRKN